MKEVYMRNLYNADGTWGLRKGEFDIVVNNRHFVGDCEYTTARDDESFDHDFGTEEGYSKYVDYIENIDVYEIIDGDDVKFVGDTKFLHEAIKEYLTERL